MTLTHLSLFTGIGGIDLAAEWAGYTTVGQVEIDPFCRKVLAKHWPDVPRMEDIRDVDGATFRGVDLVSGGFPCQPFSTAGRRGGVGDDRFLWPEMLRVIHEARPTWVLGENVAQFANVALDLVCDDLETEGYEVEPLVFPAGAVGAWHRRQRTFIVAHRPPDLDPLRRDLRQPAREGVRRHDTTCNETDSVGHVDRSPGWSHAACRWAAEPGLVRVVHGLPAGVDRLRALGNAVVPQQVYPILKAIADYEA